MNAFSRRWYVAVALSAPALGCGSSSESPVAGSAGASSAGVAGQSADSGGSATVQAGAPGASGNSTQGGAAGAGGTSASAGMPAQGGAAGAEPSPEQDDFAAMLAKYSSWAAATDQPVNVSSYLWSLCRAPTSAEQALATSEHGHDRAIREWDNDLARAALAAGRAGEFEAGAAIAKEKWAMQDGTNRLVAVGMMIHRGEGFDPSAGDWEFAYWEEGKGISRGATQSQYCAACHASSDRGDFVFREHYELR